MKLFRNVTLLILALTLLLTGCAPAAQTDDPFIDAAPLGLAILEDEAVALSDAPAAVPEFPEAEATGEKEKKNTEATIDYSNTADGYVMVHYTANTSKRLKVQVKGPSTTYTYNLTRGQWEVFPFSDGNGSYKITVYRNVSGNSYATVLSLSTEVTLEDEFAPFIRPNQYVNYSAESDVVYKAAELTEGIEDPLKKVEAVYDFVVGTLTYDKEKAKTVKSGYLPVLDEVLEEKTGICFDYASLMTAMLRSQGVPCKLVVGYAGKAYHAWISVWTEESGWVDGAIFFDGSAWKRMDPTFASSANKSASIMKYIGNGSNYTVKYLY
ncbi:MAG: transglutaminase domain-containing protein [Ruminococcaceae bacterium]|nr:transglutaminase domain-containing protein [Oscillospiraceae bacterium]